ncbi:Zn-dependent hydrolase [Aliidongia dinghuensis]|uniref:Zn-dependent hydrolase n=1 Tax=Aliidongia dinghuensis TaxID=1867774 RepID=A0A8J2YV55_9PROT|nr:allantoate amidohydrolase [Aliidongia dinghuensis]GGF19276.1 Zn-dependent hydrolase [Aliidongia dinghuensis]
MTSALDGAGLMDRLDQLAAISEQPGMLVRRFLTPEHARANALVREWMRDAGMSVRTDAIGNVIGRYEAATPGQPALLLGSHLDTVVDAGRYDGMLGVVTSIACVADLAQNGICLPFAIEVVGFADEEGTRFGATLLGSRALAGTFDRTVLDRADGDGITMAEALSRFGLDPAAIDAAARRPDELLGYVELHIEQGPVLEAEGLAVGCVTAISGATRLAVTVEGMAGHAGTVPMAGRRDALAAAAECVLLVERRAAAEPDLVGTVGRIEAGPGAVNVVPGSARFTVDLRAPADARRAAALADLIAGFEAIARHRGVTITAAKTHDAASAPCAPWLADQIRDAIEHEGHALRSLPSGAGHDGMAIAALTDIAMIFVRCQGGISHNPAEAISAADAEAGARVLARFIRDFQPRSPL